MSIRIGIFTVLVLAFLVPATLAGAGGGGGRAVDGLRLDLDIRTTRESGVDIHDVTLSVVNESTGTVTLVGDFLERSDRGDFADWMRKRSQFECDPPWTILWAQTMWGGEYTGPQPQATIPPGGRYSSYWRAGGVHLKPSDCINSYPALVDDGLYHVRARLRAIRADGGSTMLESNEVPVTIGGSDKRPRRGLCAVREFDHDARVLVLDSGASEGIAVGDEFRVHPRGLTLNVRVRVASVEESTARCEVLTEELPEVCGMTVNWTPANLEAMYLTPPGVIRRGIEVERR